MQDVEYTQTVKPWNELYKQVVMGNRMVVRVGTEDTETGLLPSNFLTKLRLSLSGGYITIRRLTIRISPLVSRKAGTSGRLYLRDITDTTGRKLHCTEPLDLGMEIRLSLQHVDFMVPANEECPIVFGFEELVSPFLEGRTLFTVSLGWQFGLSTRSYSLPPTKWKVIYQEDALKKKVPRAPASK